MTCASVFWKKSAGLNLFEAQRLSEKKDKHKQSSSTWKKIKINLGIQKIKNNKTKENWTKPRTSVDMDGTLKIGNYKVGGTQKPFSFTETQYFFFK